MMWRAVPGILFMLIVAVMLFSTWKKGTNEAGSELVGKEVPRLHTTPIEGFNKIPDNAVLFRHQYVLVNFFASWCTPCLAEHPYLNQLSQEYELQIIGVAWRDSASNIQEMLKIHGNPYDYVALDKMDASAYAFGVVGLPESFLIGPDGKVVMTHRGPLVPDVIKEKLLPFILSTPSDKTSDNTF